MAINIADGFQYLGKKSLDARTQYATLAVMKAVADANINEGCLAYCVETDKYYKFKSTNTVDADTGKWREYSSSGGASAFSNLTDVSISDVQNGQVPKWNSQTSKWENADESGGSSSYTAGDGIFIDNDEISTDNMEQEDMSEVTTPLPSVMSRRFKYSTQEQVVGTWIDGKPLYQKGFSGTWAIDANQSQVVGNIANLDSLIDCKGFGYVTAYPNELRTIDGANGLGYANKSSGDVSIKSVGGAITWKNLIVQYTKTTD